MIEPQIIWALEMQSPFISLAHDYRLVGLFSSPEMAMWCVDDESGSPQHWQEHPPLEVMNGLKGWCCTARLIAGKHIYIHGYRVTACSLDGMYLERKLKIVER